MHPQASRYLEAVQDPEIREQLRVFFDAYDSMDRENTHLRLKLQAKGCPYGHASAAGCQLGYPGCACMDDLMALMAWSPQDEDKAAVRIGQRLQATEAVLEEARQTLIGAAMHLEARQGDRSIIAACRKAAAARVSVPA